MFRVFENLQGAIPPSLQMKLDTSGSTSIKVLRDGFFDQFPCDVLQADEKRVWLTSERMIVVGSEVQVNASPVVLFGKVETCTRAERGYVVLIQVDELVDASCNALRATRRISG